MPFLADLHLHSPYSRATSRDMRLEGLSTWAQKKGISLLAASDFTHPTWFAELSKKLEPAEPGLFRLRDKERHEADAPLPENLRAEVRFLLSTEVSCIYKKNGRCRKIHHLLWLPSLESAARFNADLGKIGNLRSDGRPILGLDSLRLFRLLKEADPEAVLIPAHAWTPHFSLFGAHSGFDTLEECFEDLSGEIFAIETGLSSDPPMNWRLSQLDRIALISNSDAHSPAKLGREANLFGCEMSYPGVVAALRSDDPALFQGTLEFFPEEGKYHYDGHRACGRRMTPAETRANQGNCPACGKAVTVGVLHRVEALADRPEGRKSPKARPYQSLVPLAEILSEVLGVGVNTRKVATRYETLLAAIGPEFYILRSAPLAKICEAAGKEIAEAVGRVRRGELSIAAGYDGEFGTVSLGGQPHPGGSKSTGSQYNRFKAPHD